MRLAPLLATLSDEELARVAMEHVRTDDKLSRPQLCHLLEGSLRSYRFVHDFITNRQPPTFGFLTLLLDAPQYELPKEGFQERVMAETRRIGDLIASGELLAREEQLQLYRRTLYEARRSDLDLNSSEAALLSLLRRETNIAQVEHFLIEHHQDLREFWDKDDPFAHEENALRSAGLVFFHNDRVMIPEEVAPAVWQTLGIDMPTDSARRLVQHLSSSELADALEAAGVATSGSKEMRLERVLLQRIQPRAILDVVGLSTLKEICRATDAPVTGNKEELVERIIEHFAQRKDQREEEPPLEPVAEPRRLDLERFETLFSSLLHQELTDILRRFADLRQTGTKETKIKTLWTGHRSEQTFLGELMNRDLENILNRLGLKLGGSKRDRIERIVGHFDAVHFPTHTSVVGAAVAEPDVGRVTNANSEFQGRRELFRQKASNPSSSLQPWLEQILEAPGVIRCYGTEDPNPTKQLKNKLSQAAAARGGLLLLLLSDESSFSKAREALMERWMTNPEWSKSVSAVALAFPTSAPEVAAVVEHSNSSWAVKIRERLFPAVEIIRVTDKAGEANETLVVKCSECGDALPAKGKFCPNCGSPRPS
jgi:hypothetical protein